MQNVKRGTKKKKMRPVYLASGGVSKFVKARQDATFQVMVKEAFVFVTAPGSRPYETDPRVDWDEGES